MYIQIRTADGSKSKRVEVSKLTSIEELKGLVENALNVIPEKQRLFFRGKQLEDGYTVFDYNINLNDCVMLMEKIDVASLGTSSKSTEEKDPKEAGVNSESELKAESKFFKVGDTVDAIYDVYGAWFEGTIVSIVKNTDKIQEPGSKGSTAMNASDSSSDQCVDVQDDGLLYKVSFYFSESDNPVSVPLQCVRPRMSTRLNLSTINVGDIILVNYNIQSPDQRGFWYDMKVTEVTDKVLIGTLLIGRQHLTFHNCNIIFLDEIVKIERVKTHAEVHVKDDGRTVTGKKAPSCSHCKDTLQRKCKECACHVCGGKDEPERQLMCDECDMAYHLRCLKPPLEALPDVEEWYCPLCKNDENEIVKAGEKLKESKKKKRMPSGKEDKSKRDWGKGMACAGRTRECTIVPPNHFGPIPGVEVGMMWKFRLTASEFGVHRPPVSGIHGRDSEGAYSIVLSGGYEDDVDNGEEFYYTGSGGRDLSGNKRSAEQSSDQTLTRMNLALAMNCNAKVDKDKGAEATDWQGGKPVRVLRNYKLAKHSEYAPEEGNRYDGIYKVVKYYPEKGESGFIVWRYLLRRDDPSPAPWTKEGQKRVESLGLKMIYPDGYEEMMAAKEEESLGGEDNGKSKKRQRKSVLCDAPVESPSAKKAKLEAFILEADIEKEINADTLNAKAWGQCKESLQDGKHKFLAAVQENFMCICCQELVFEPITTECHHNMCKACLKRSFSAAVYTCPSCRNELGKNFKLDVNQNLSSALLQLFPGYEVGR